MFERFTNEARLVLVHAQEATRRLGHGYIGSAHVLVGVLTVADGGAAMLVARGIDSASVEDAIAIRRPSAGPSSGHIPFTTHAKKCLELSQQMAEGLGSTEIAPGHLLLALLAGHESFAVEIIAARVADLAELRSAVIEEIRSAPLRGRGGSKAKQATVARNLKYSTPDTDVARLRAGLGENIDDTTAERRTTAAARLEETAARFAKSGPVGSQHLVMAAIADPSSAAAKALDLLGVSVADLLTALREVDVTGTSDDTQQSARRRTAKLGITPDRLTLTVTDPGLIDLAARAAGVQNSGGTGEISGDESDAEALGEVIEVLRACLWTMARNRNWPD